MLYLGEIAAIGTAISWSACALFFTSASRKIGSFTMSHFRMLFGTILIATAQVVITGELFPVDISLMNWVLLALSGLTGYFLCDACLFQCHVDLGPRLGILIFNFYPFVSAFLAWLFLKEHLSSLAWLGVVVTMSGVIFVLSEKRMKAPHVSGEHTRRGIILAVMAVIFQGISFTLAKPAMMGSEGVEPLTATLVRAIFGGAAFWLVSLFRGKIHVVAKKMAHGRAISMIAMGAIVGPSVGVWLSMVAIKNAPVGIASTLMALMPIAILPMTAIVYKEKITIRAIVGAVIACLGVFILFNV